jgi:hypothetical protein
VQIVDKKSATLGLPGTRETQIALDRNHANICKFDHINSDDYEQVIENLDDFAERALNVVAERQRLESLSVSTTAITPERLKTDCK